MKKFTVLGNCQSLPIKEYLLSSKDFRDNFEYVPLKPVHTVSPTSDADLLEIFPEVDLLIYQPVVDKKRFGGFVSSNVLSLMKKDASTVCIPPLYYGGYFPTFESIPHLEGPLRGVHDYFVLACYLMGVDKNSVVDFYKKDYPLSDEFIKAQHKGFIDGLKNRELKFSVDIVVSDFIESKFKENYLFYTFNHPTPVMLRYLCDEILKFLGFDSFVRSDIDTFSDLTLPISKQVVNVMDLEFETPNASYKGCNISMENMICEFYQLYSNFDSSFLMSSLKAKKKFLLDLDFLI